MIARVDPAPSATLRFHDARMAFHPIVATRTLEIPPTYALRRMAPRPITKGTPA